MIIDHWKIALLNTYCLEVRTPFFQPQAPSEVGDTEKSPHDNLQACFQTKVLKAARVPVRRETHGPLGPPAAVIYFAGLTDQQVQFLLFLEFFFKLYQ